MTCKLQPIGAKIVVSQDDPEGKSRGGILLPDSAKVRIERGTVLAVGEGRWSKDGKTLIPNNIKVGDRVLWAGFMGGECKIGGETYMVIGMEDVWGILAE